MHLVYNKKRFILFVLPLILLFTALMFAPILYSVYLSFTQYPGYGDPEWIGLRNFVRMFQDKYVWISIGNTFKIMGVSTLISMPISFLLALYLKKSSIRSSLYKTVFFMPYVIPGIISGLIWLFIFDPNIGLINNFLTSIGLDSWRQLWIGGQTLSPYSMAIIVAWSNLGFNMALWTTGLKAIPTEVLEASEIDGTTKWQRIIHVILPMVKDTGKIILIFSITNGFKIFDLVYQLTGGGPNHASETIVSYMYSTTFSGKMYGYGIAISVFQFILCLILTLGVQRLMRRRVDE